MKRFTILTLSILAFSAIATLSILDPAQAHTRITTDVTWSENIREIFIAKCMDCHHPGGIAPDYVDLTRYGTDTEPGARAWAVSIQEEILTDGMPPWKPDARFGAFDHDKRLTQEELDMIVAWVDGGAPQGPYRNLPIPEQFVRYDWQYGGPDIIVALPQGHVMPADEQYDTADAVVPIEIEEDTYITGYEFLVENPKNIFRMTAWLHDPEGVELPPVELEVQTEYDPLADEDEAEVTRMREMPKGPHFIGQWVRGDKPVMFPSEAGILLRKGSSVELRIEYERPEYADWSEDVRDNSKVGLFIAQTGEEVDLLVETRPMQNSDFTIKANEASQAVQAELTFDEGVNLIGLNPYTGTLGKSLNVTIIYPDGLSQTLMWLPEHKRKWTTSYIFEEPIVAPAGTRLVLTGQYDNSADNWDNPNDPPIDIPSGEDRDHEQLYAMLTYTLADHLNIEEVFVPRERSPQEQLEGGMTGIAALPDGLIDAIDPKDPGAPVPPTPEEAAETEGPIRLAYNRYHQLEGVMNKPGEFDLIIYDENLVPLDPRHFSGTITTQDSSDAQPLVYHLAGDDHLSAWVKPEFPVTISAKVTLAGKEESFEWTFDGLPEADEDAAATKRAFMPAPRGGWIHMMDDGVHRIEATLEEPGDLRLYFYEDDGANLKAINPQSFAGRVSLVNAETGDPTGVNADLRYPGDNADYLSAKIAGDLPAALDAFIIIGADQKKFRFDFDELTEAPWDDDWGTGTAEELPPVVLGPHGSPEVRLASNGFHAIEAAMPRPGELRLYFYDEWKNLISPALFQATLTSNGQEIPVSHFNPGDDFLSAFMNPTLPVTLESEIWIKGNQETFTFSFDAITVDPATVAAAGTAHMDHTPMHGGWFFMADDQFHHVEGTMPSPGNFQIYFYDDFKREVDPRNFAGTVFLESEAPDPDTGESTWQEIPLEYARPGDPFLSARLPSTQLPSKLYVEVWLGGEEKRYDFEFEELTIEPIRTLGLAGTSTEVGAEHSHTRAPVVIPDTIEGILEAIDARERDLGILIQTQDWNRLFIPAFDSRDLLAALAERDNALRGRQVSDLKSIVAALNRSVGKIEATAHTNDPPRVQRAADEFSDALEDLRKLYSSVIQ